MRCEQGGLGGLLLRLKADGHGQLRLVGPLGEQIALALHPWHWLVHAAIKICNTTKVHSATAKIML